MGLLQLGPWFLLPRTSSCSPLSTLRPSTTGVLVPQSCQADSGSGACALALSLRASFLSHGRMWCLCTMSLSYSYAFKGQLLREATLTTLPKTPVHHCLLLLPLPVLIIHSTCHHWCAINRCFYLCLCTIFPLGCKRHDNFILYPSAWKYDQFIINEQMSEWSY